MVLRIGRGVPWKRTQDGFISWKQTASRCVLRSLAREAVPERPVPMPMTIMANPVASRRGGIESDWSRRRLLTP